MNDKPSKRLVKYDLTVWEFQEWDTVETVPEVHRWAFQHILQHECGSVACGKIVYEVRKVAPAA